MEVTEPSPKTSWIARARSGAMGRTVRVSKRFSSGTGKVTFQGDQAFTMQLNANTSARGTPEQVNVASTGKWLGASCPVAQKP